MSKITIPIPESKLDSNLKNSIKEYLNSNTPSKGGIIFLDEFAINGGPIEDKICENVRNKR